MTTRQKKSLVNRVLTLQDKGRAIYQQKDDVLSRLLAQCAPGEVIETEHGQFAIHDNFAERNVSYRPAAVHRFELKEVKQPRRPAASDAAAPQPEEALPSLVA